MIDLSGYDFTDNYVESRLQEIQTMLRSQTEEKHQFLVIHHSLTVGMNAHISKSVEMKVLEKTISSIKFEGTEKVDYTVYIWYNVSIKYRRCFYDRTTAEIDAKSIHGNI